MNQARTQSAGDRNISCAVSETVSLLRMTIEGFALSGSA